ncbi:MAG TPA: DMT family transporter [Polyangia bacterium]|jgi:drug/metabolite transporter (DMT)-like permease
MTRAALMALVAAALFGASAPVAKRLLAEVSPSLLAALLYAGCGLVGLPFLARAWKRREAPLRAADVPLLAGVVGFGGVAGPLLLLYGLERTSATLAALLLNLEAVFTTAIAVIVFREWIGRRGLGALAVVVAGCALSTWAAGGATATPIGPLAVAAACACWAIDNNLTQRLSLKDPLAVVAVKGLGAAPIAFAIASGTHAAWPRPGVIAGALALGAISYGVSLALYVRATRTLGAARTGVLFAAAPFVGAALAIPIAGDPPSLRVAGAALLIAAGVALLVTEDHGHRHRHDPLDHEHLHTHDEHHQHAHRGDEGPPPHSHPHHHDSIEHTHAHASDAHHRHKH